MDYFAKFLSCWSVSITLSTSRFAVCFQHFFAPVLVIELSHHYYCCQAHSRLVSCFPALSIAKLDSSSSSKTRGLWILDLPPHSAFEASALPHSPIRPALEWLHFVMSRFHLSDSVEAFRGDALRVQPCLPYGHCSCNLVQIHLATRSDDLPISARM
jgi:hypothetical protein